MEIKHIEGYDCVDDNLGVILKNKNIDIRKIFSNLWYFEFNKEAETLGKGLMQSDDNKYEKIKENFNINYMIYENLDRNNEIKLKNFGVSKRIKANEINKIIKNKCNDNNNIIIAELDTSKYKYDKGFQKYIGTHSCIITGKIENKAQIMDVWYNLYNVEIEYKELIDAITRVVVLDTSNIKEKEFTQRNFISHIINDKSISEMYIFFDKLFKINLEKEYMNLGFDMVFKAPIDKGLRKIIMNRQRFAYYLYYLEEKFSDKKELGENGKSMHIISMEWAKLRNILLQTYFLNRNIKLEQISEVTKNILRKEIKIKEELEKIRW